MNVCARYHPPKPTDDVALFHQHWLNSAANVADDDPDCIFVLRGDLNKLNTSEMQTELDLDQIISVPTHNNNNNNVMDVFVTNRPDLFTV